MPLVLVFYDRREVEDSAMVGFNQSLPAVVAKELSVSGGGELEPKDVEVKTFAYGILDIAQGYGVSVVILANLYPQRLEELEERKERLADEVQKTLSLIKRGVRAYVWVLLANGAFKDFVS